MEESKKEKKLEQFWSLYDQYVASIKACSELEIKADIRQRLSVLLAQVERKDRYNPLCRPEKGWMKPVAWQVLREQQFLFMFGKSPLILSEGEVIVWDQENDRDVLVGRIPRVDFIAGRVLKPGFHMDYSDRGDRSEEEWRKCVFENGLTDERGLYLPVYDRSLIVQFCEDWMSAKYQETMDFLQKKFYLEPV
jgi:hypothetical protein